MNSNLSDMITTGIQQIIDEEDDNGKPSTSSNRLSNSSNATINNNMSINSSMSDLDDSRSKTQNELSSEKNRFFRVHICESNQDWTPIGYPFIVAYTGNKGMTYKKIINGCVKSGKKEPIQLLFNPNEGNLTAPDECYTVLDQFMFEDMFEFLFSSSTSKTFINVRALSYQKAKPPGVEEGIEIGKGADAPFGKKLLNRLESTYEKATDEEKVKLEKVKIRNEQKEEIPKAALEIYVGTTLFLDYEGRLEPVRVQGVGDVVKVRNTSFEIIDFINQRKRQRKSNKRSTMSSTQSSHHHDDESDNN